MRWMRALAAAGLSLLLPGAGHALVRAWGRALIFFSLFLASMALLFPVEELWSAAADGAVTDVPGIVDAETSIIAQFTVWFLVLFAAIDAGFHALGLAQGPGGSEDGPSCPQCGEPLDDELSFCHWCTTRLDVAEDEEPVSS